MNEERATLGAYMESKANSWVQSAGNLEEQANSLHKWILASCLTINGGGVVLVLSNEEVTARPSYFAALWFAIGIISCVSYAMAHVSLLNHAASKIRELSRHFEEAGRRGENMPSQEEALKPIQRIWRINIAIDFFQYVSLSSFIIGAVIVGLELR
ncbi:hypothetical protein [Allopontixanthobacter sediminis]|uniref:SMODS and SLOG-associating 2TM effector domain-containing protein n=1 Tax=Allopontixanthobacter sediminis TaxID=1689985 RepID=A0A845B1Y4_9SPHN|nr:hypothetical protein [Allopontixanthobacter sediminis]MXP44134.1 hypothetical protein [Allopontixanthobacter sediminis]